MNSTDYIKADIQLTKLKVCFLKTSTFHCKSDPTSRFLMSNPNSCTCIAQRVHALSLHVITTVSIKSAYPVNPFFLLTGEELPVPPEELG